MLHTLKCNLLGPEALATGASPAGAPAVAPAVKHDRDMYQEIFDRLHESGRDAVRTRRHIRDTPPVEGGPRYGMSVVLRPSAALAARLDAMTAEALALAGDQHWSTGAVASVHFTLRTLEPYRDQVSSNDAAVQRYATALRRAAEHVGPAGMTVTGLALTPRSVMACAAPLNAAADELATRFGAMLGDDGWYEADVHRDIWYANLVHFTGPVADPSGLIDWVSARRRLAVGDTKMDTAEVAAWRHTATGMAPERLAAVRLSDGSGP